MKMSDDTKSRTYQNNAPTILISPCEHPRYIASGRLYNASIQRVKHHIYKNKRRAHCERGRFPDHVTVLPMSARPQRPWYTVHQCLDEKCSIHPGSLKLTDVTEIRKEDGEKLDFICSFLQNRVDISLYPFYKRSIECYKSSFDKKNSGIDSGKNRSGLWHDPTCTKCEQKELHSVAWLQYTPPADEETLLAEIGAISCKYRYVFDLNYVLGTNGMNKNISKETRAEDFKTKSNLGIVHTTDTPRTLSFHRSKLNFDSDSSASSSLNRHTPSQKHGISLPHFSRQNTPISSPLVKARTPVSPYISSPYKQPLTPCRSTGASPFWTSYRQPIQNSSPTWTSYRQPIQNIAQAFNTSYSCTSQLCPIPDEHYSTIPDQNQLYSSPNQSFYYDNYNNSQKTVFGGVSHFHPMYSANFSPAHLPIHMWYRQNPGYWPNPQWAPVFSPAPSAHRLSEVQAGNIDFNSYKRGRKSDYDVEDPLTNLDTDYSTYHAKPKRKDSRNDDIAKHWRGEKPYDHIRRYTDSSSRSNFDSYSFTSSRQVLSSRDEERKRGRTNGYGSYCKRRDESLTEKHTKRRKTANDDRHYFKRSDSFARNVDSFRPTANSQNKKEDERKLRTYEDCQRKRKRQTSYDRTSRSCRRSLQKSHTRERSSSPKVPRVASTVIVVRKENPSNSKSDRRK